MWEFRALVLAITLAVTTPFSWSRQGGTPQPRAKTPTSSQNVLPTKGLIDHDTYKNPFIGLEFTPAKGLRLKEPGMKGTPGTTPLIITVQAETDPGSNYGLTVFYADALAYYPEEQRNAARYLQKVIRANEADGFQHVDGGTSAQISGTPFICADFVKGAVHETILVMTHDAFAFVFIFAGSDVGVTSKLIASTNMKLTR
jgi:hypothetical protein